MSGGPTAGLDGRVVGVNSFTPVGEQQAFNFIATASQLNALLGRNNVTAELGPVDRTYREGLIQYFEGEYSDAIATFDEVLALAPDFRQAEEFRAKAIRARAQFGDAGPPGWIWFATAGGVLLVVVAVLVVLVIRRRRAPQTPAFSGSGPHGGVPSQRDGGGPVQGYGEGPWQGYGGGPWQGYGASPSEQETPAQPGPVTPGYGIPTQGSPGSAGMSVPAPGASGPPLGRGCSRCGAEPPLGARFLRELRQPRWLTGTPRQPGKTSLGHSTPRCRGDSRGTRLLPCRPVAGTHGNSESGSERLVGTQSRPIASDRSSATGTSKARACSHAAVRISCRRCRSSTPKTRLSTSTPSESSTSRVVSWVARSTRTTIVYPPSVSIRAPLALNSPSSSGEQSSSRSVPAPYWVLPRGSAKELRKDAVYDCRRSDRGSLRPR